ncbi:MAG: putative zinc-binding metallopeptidase [Gammaproteobacteria bacterium]
MQRFSCVCDHELFFDNVQCLSCQRTLGFDCARIELLALEPAEDGTWRESAAPSAPPRRFCANARDHAVCNWLLEADSEETLCASCRLNDTIPDLSVADNVALWARMEAAKRRLVYSLLALELPFAASDTTPGLRFSFLAPQPGQPVTTGHAEGHVTLALTEADEAERVRVRENLGESYRTLLGHLRHESGHYYWWQVIRDSPWVPRFRALFGDEGADYDAALERHYAEGAPADWSAHHVSAYASAHPWEDWAESWAHYLHIRDTLDTAQAFRFTVAAAPGLPVADLDRRDFKSIVAAWVPFSLAVNELSRSMGQPDIYPFVLPPAAIAKLQLVHEVVLTSAQPDSRATAPR